MTDNKWLRDAALFMMLILAFACKKDEEVDTNLYMKGVLVAKIPTHMIVNQDINLNATGITLPVDSLSYKWYTYGFSVDSVLGNNITIKAPVKTGDYTMSVNITHPRYTTKSQTFKTIVVDPESPDSFGGVVKSNKFIEDSRDGKKYYYSTIGELDWFNFNLSWKGAGNPYMLTDALGEIYGRLYNWNEAKTACPVGWRLPDNNDWKSLAAAISGNNTIVFDNKWAGLGAQVAVKATLNSVNIWKYSPNMEFANKFYWNAIPAGNVTGNFRTYLNRGEYGTWWSADEKDSATAYYRYIFFDSPDFPYNFADKGTFGASVRCVRNTPLK
jgi:uncharacterized protein (TIGR02145 family)